ncbi:30S ribosomal protein S1 A [Tetrabaena socialis]|uniref:30S ribosomal protein S1 A n=1 Tax=Tetrabaena socialis TaxID=47790 RepID=A0A2J7ZY11_9CHLO|nr:30S ribosomal protein S1 A [Tetrabaena socialis]|eukprot:PNH05145.1 30S ribosomal protein S1 A [Tetrabaena socialis]
MKGHVLAPRSVAQRSCLPPARSFGAACRRSLVAQAPRRNTLATRVAAIEDLSSQPQPEQPTEAYAEQPVEQTDSSILDVDPAVVEELELQELDQAQEHLLKWMMLDEVTQEQDLDEMIDYDEFGDEEYADMHEEVEEMLEAVDYDFKVGDKVTGTVIELDDDGAYVEIGAKAIAFCPVTECSFARLKTPLEALRPGMKRDFMVVEHEEEYGQVIVSLAAMEATTFWARIRQLQDEDNTVSVTVESVNKGGMLVKFGIYDGFIPVSQFGPAITSENMETLIGFQLQVKFLEVDEEAERLVFSHKRASSTVSNDVQGFKVGDVVAGVVQSVKPYGAFIDLGGVTGLLHVSQISHERVLVLDKIVQEGDKIKVMILSQDRERGRVTLSTKKLEPTPGESCATTFWARIRQLQDEDITVSVTVESVNKGGMLVKFGIYDGFIPVSQFGPAITSENMETLIGFQLQVKFLEVDEEAERLVFSHKRASSTVSNDVQGFKVGDVVAGVVQSVKPYGAFIDLGGVTGLLHVSQISHERVLVLDKIVQEGDKIKVMILSQDRERGRVTLSTKKLEPTPGDMLRDPQLVYEKAEEMAEMFRKRVAEAAASAAEVQPDVFNQQGGSNDGLYVY